MVLKEKVFDGLVCFILIVVNLFYSTSIALAILSPGGHSGYSGRCGLSNGARVVRGERSPIQMLIKQDYYVRPEAEDEINKDGIRLVSFDWGGVLDIYEMLKEDIEQLLDAFKDAGIVMIIVSEGGRKGISDQLKDLGWREYFKEIYYIPPGIPGVTKRAILETIANNLGIKKNQIVHFEDTPSQVEKIGYKMGKEPEVFVIGVVGKVYTQAEDVKYRDFAEKLLKVAPAVISHLGIGADKILEEILNIKER